MEDPSLPYLEPPAAATGEVMGRLQMQLGAWVVTATGTFYSPYPKKQWPKRYQRRQRGS